MEGQLTKNWGLKFRQTLEHPLAVGLGLSIAILINVYSYRLGSARVDKGQDPGLRDLGTYLSAGQQFLTGVDPYLNPNYRAGPSLLLIFGVLEKFVSPSVLGWALQLATVIGVLFFVNFFSGVKLGQNFVPYLIIIFLSSTRENLVNIQLTGFLALIFAYGIKFILSQTFSIRTVIGVFLTGIAIDTKPHLFLLTFLYVVVYKGKKRCFLFMVMSIVFTHTLISIYLEKNITISYLRQIISLTKMRSDGELSESLVFWPILEEFLLSPRTTIVLSYLVLASLIIILLSKLSARKDYENGILLSLLIPAFGIFFHYYDLALVIALSLMILKKRNSKLYIPLAMFFLIPENVLHLENILFMALITTLIFVSQVISKVNIIYCSGSFVLWVIYGIALKGIANFVDVHSLQMTISSFVLLAAVFFHQEKNTKREISPLSRFLH